MNKYIDIERDVVDMRQIRRMNEMHPRGLGVISLFIVLFIGSLFLGHIMGQF